MHIIIKRHLLNLYTSFQNYHMALPQASPHYHCNAADSTKYRRVLEASQTTTGPITVGAEHPTPRLMTQSFCHWSKVAADSSQGITSFDAHCQLSSTSYTRTFIIRTGTRSGGRQHCQGLVGMARSMSHVYGEIFILESSRVISCLANSVYIYMWSFCTLICK